MTIQAINVRDQFRGRASAIIEGELGSRVDGETPAGSVTSVITTRSVPDLGTEVVAIVEATGVSIARLWKE
jgi:molybdopterin-binding protein